MFVLLNLFTFCLILFFRINRQVAFAKDPADLDAKPYLIYDFKIYKSSIIKSYYNLYIAKRK